MIESISNPQFESEPELDPQAVLILAPTGQDATLIASVLSNFNIRAICYHDIGSLCERAMKNAGAILIAEEALSRNTVQSLKNILEKQEPWSDIPIVLLTSDGETTLASHRILKDLSAVGNVTLLERPFRKITLGSTLQVALRSRIRQYQVRDLLRKQVEATRMRDEFISIASHELKTPLTSLKLQNQIHQRILKNPTPTFSSPERVHQLVESTGRQVDRLGRLIEDMLDVSRIHTGKLTLEKAETDLAELILEVLEGMSAQLTMADCEVDLKLEPHTLVVCDRYRIEQVIINLLTNAIRYAGGAPIFIQLEGKNGFAEISVRDSGPGISTENQQRIFDRFERAVSSSNISGLGLGLYICREIIESHGGQISLSSKEGEGATFLIRLPLG